jgi:hypothetical protein
MGRTLIENLDDILANVEKLRNYLVEGGEEGEFARDRIGQGICFVVTKDQHGVFFAPSRFVGYKNNDIDTHNRRARGDEPHRDGRETNRKISQILHFGPVRSPAWEDEYKSFCNKHRIAIKTAFDGKPKFWDLRNLHKNEE